MIIEANDPWEAERKIHKTKIRALNEEIIRLKIKCGEAFTENEMLNGFGNAPAAFKIVKPAALKATPE